MKNTILSKTVWVLSFVSLFADVASEMLYPIMPIYLKSIGFSVLLIGILEGLAEGISGISKGYFGNLSDRRGIRLPFVRIGYLLSAISKPLMAIIQIPIWIFSARTLDRIGKGIRSGARDAILSDEATPETKGKVFGFHRGMDTTGAVIGPAIALVYLYFNPQQYKYLFYIAFVPGLLSVLLLYFIKKESLLIKKDKKPYNFLSFFHYLQKSPKDYKLLLVGLLLFALFNSSDYFLLLKLKSSGFKDVYIIYIYILYNIVYALTSYPLGKLGDKIGFKNVLIIGLLLFALVYAGMAYNDNYIVYLLLFVVYGVYAASTEGISKAWISNISAKNEIATAIGTYNAFQSICTMISSSVAGLIWFVYGSKSVFLMSAVVSIMVFVYFITVFIKVKK